MRIRNIKTDDKGPEAYKDWDCTNKGFHLIGKKYFGNDIDVKIPDFYDIDRDVFEGKDIRSITVLYTEKLHHRRYEPMPGCENVRSLYLHYNGEGAAFLYLRGWLKQLPNLSEIHVLQEAQHQLIIWEGVPEVPSDVVLTDATCNKLSVYGYGISDVTLPTPHFFLSVNLPLTALHDPAIRAAVLWTMIKKPEVLSDEKVQEYRKSLFRNGVRWIPTFMQHKVADEVMIPLLKEIQPLKAEQYERLLSAAQDEENMVMAAVVIEEREKYVDRRQEEQKRERQSQYDFEHPFSARNMRAEWRWKTWKEKEIILTQCLTDNVDTILVPPEIAGRTVAALGDALFKKKYVREIVLPDTIRYIGSECFMDSSVQTIILPEKLEDLCDAAFTYCTELKEITLPGGIQKVSYSLFRGSAIETVTVSHGITEIGDDSFSYCRQLKTVHLPDGLQSIGEDCFFSSSLQEIVLPPSLKKIGRCTFMRTHLKECTLPEEIDMIEPECFRESQIRKVRISKTLRYIGDEAFEGCEKLTTIECPDEPPEDGRVFLPDEVREIGKGAFFRCRNIKEIHLPAELREITVDVFRETGLEHVSIPKEVRKLGIQAFAFCKNLQTVEFDEDAKLEEINGNCFSDSGIREMCLPKNVKLVEGFAFENCREMNRLECYEHTAVDRNAMYGTKLQSDLMSLVEGKQVWTAKDSDSKKTSGSRENP